MTITGNPISGSDRYKKLKERLNMEWIKAIIEKHLDDEGKLNQAEAIKEINAEFPKQAIPKDQYNNVSQQLKDANKTIADLKEQTKDNPDLQKKLEEAEANKARAEKELKQLEIKVQASDKLRNEKVIDVDYALFKLGELELDNKGQIKDFDSKFKEFKEAYPNHVQADDDKAKAEPPRFAGTNPANGGKDLPKPKTTAERLAEEANEKQGTPALDLWA